jgi:hypothetical protein
MDDGTRIPNMLNISTWRAWLARYCTRYGEGKCNVVKEGTVILVHDRCRGAAVSIFEKR